MSTSGEQAAGSRISSKRWELKLRLPLQPVQHHSCQPQVTKSACSMMAGARAVVQKTEHTKHRRNPLTATDRAMCQSIRLNSLVKFTHTLLRTVLSCDYQKGVNDIGGFILFPKNRLQESPGIVVI